MNQVFKAARYRGHRWRMSASISAKSVSGWAGLLMRVDDSTGSLVSFGNMQDRPLRGSFDWQEHVVVLDFPAESDRITFGALLVGTGSVWVDDFLFEAEGADLQTAGRTHELPNHPYNLGFEE